MSKMNRILSLLLCIILFGSNLVYADTVLIGSAPNSGEKPITQSASGTTYLQNQFTGPGTLPNSANTLGTTPIQAGVSVDNASNISTSNIDNHGVVNSGPTTTTIKSPAANNAALAENKGSSNVITNGIRLEAADSNTSNDGPVSSEILSPGADEPKYNNDTEEGKGPGNNGPDYNPANIPSYNTPVKTETVDTNITMNNSDVIVYQVNDNIAAIKPNVSSEAAIVVNATTRQIYYSKNGFESLPPAGIANLVTAYLLASSRGLDDALTITQTALAGIEEGATVANLKVGDTIFVRDAIASMFVKSYCDVANVVAENISGNVANFVALMNQTVKNWGCVGTNFTNPSGLNNDAQKTNVYDMAIIMDKVTQNQNIKLLLGLSEYTLPATALRTAEKITSKNNLLNKLSSNYYAGIVASRMGYTSKAKYTMASMIEYNGQKLIVVVLKSNNTQYTDTTKLLNYAKVAAVEMGAQGSVATNTSVANTSIGTVAAGDSAGTWQQNTNGWYFVKSNGTYANNEWIKQNGKMYCVDSTGYMITGWREFSNGKFYYFEPTSGEFKYNTWVNVSTGAYYLQADGSLATADKGTTKNIVTSVGTYTIDENGKAIAKVN